MNKIFAKGLNLASKGLLAILIALPFAPTASAINPHQVEWHNEATDTIRINEILKATADAAPRTGSERMAYIGQMLLGTPYVAHTLEGDEELLRVNIDELDCTTFVETVAAMALTVAEGRTSWRDFIYHLENIRYRNGEMDGYGSRLHYICDWVVNNGFRGNVREITTDLDGVRYAVKSIDFMTENRDKYTSLADSATYEKIRTVESGYRNHRFPFVKSSAFGTKEVMKKLRSGDILAFTSTLKNLDVTHMGMVLVRDGVPHVMHASMSAGKVVVSDVPIGEFMRRNRQFTGARVLRLRD